MLGEIGTELARPLAAQAGNQMVGFLSSFGGRVKPSPGDLASWRWQAAEAQTRIQAAQATPPVAVGQKLFAGSVVGIVAFGIFMLLTRPEVFKKKS